MYYTNIIYDDDGWEYCRRMKMKTSKKIKVFLKLFFLLLRLRLLLIVFFDCVQCSFAFCAREILWFLANFFLFRSHDHTNTHTSTSTHWIHSQVWSIIIARVCCSASGFAVKGRFDRLVLAHSLNDQRFKSAIDFALHPTSMYEANKKMSNTRHTWSEKRSWGDDSKSTLFFLLFFPLLFMSRKTEMLVRTAQRRLSMSVVYFWASSRLAIERPKLFN